MLKKVMTVIKYGIVFPLLSTVLIFPLCFSSIRVIVEEIFIWCNKMDSEQFILKDNLNAYIPVYNFLRKTPPSQT